MSVNQTVNVNLAFTANADQVKRELNNVRQQLNDIAMKSTSKGIFGGQITQELREASNAALELQTHLERATNAETGKLDLHLLNNSLKESGMTLAQYGQKLVQIGPEGERAFHNVALSILNAEVPLRRTSKLLDRFATTFANTARYQLSARILSGFTGALQSAFSYAKDLNESLNNIRIVTGQSADQMADFAKQANKAAQALSTTTTEYTNASLIFYQQGLTGEAVTERVDTVIKLANVTGQSAEDISSYMTAIWNNFADGSETLEHYADVITNLGANTASSSREIAEGLEKFAAVSQTVGLSYDYATTALATVVAQTRQSADIVGNAFKTLFSRLQGLSLGETLDDGTTLNKYSEALNKVGINIKEQNGELKAADKILDEMGAKWRTLNKDQQMALAQSVAGVRQYTQLIALMDNWDKFQQNLGYAEGAEGSLQKQADIYAESWEAARDRVKAAAEDIYNQLLDDQFFIDLNNGLTEFLRLLSRLIKGLGGLKGVLTSISNIALTLFGSQITNGLRTFAYNMQDPKQIANKMRKDALNSYKNLYSGPEDDIYGAQKEENYKNFVKAQSAYYNSVSNMSVLEQDISRKKLEQLETMYKEINAARELDIEAGKRQTRTETELNQAQQIVQEKQDAVDLAKQEQQIAQEALAKKQLQKAALAGSYSSFANNLRTQVSNIRGQVAQGQAPSKISFQGKNFKDQTGTLEQYRQALNKATPGTKEFEQALKNLEKAANGLDKEAKNLVSNSNTEKTEINELTDKTKQLTQAEKELTEAKEKEEQISEKYKAARENANQTKDDLANKEKQFKEETDKAAKGFQEASKKTADFADVTIHAAQGLTGIISGINAIKGMNDIWNDESLSSWEKFSSTVMTISFALPMVINGVKALVTMVTSELTPALLNATAALTGTAVAEGAVTKGFPALIGAIKAFGAALLGVIASNPYLLALAAVLGALGASFLALKMAEEKQLREQEGLENAAKQLKNTYQETKNTLSDLSSSFDQYKSIVEGLNQCATSTKEWKEQLEKVNEEVLNIIDKYPQLLQYVSRDDNGVLSIDENAFENIINETQNKLIKFRATSQLADLNTQQYTLTNTFDKKFLYSNNDSSFTEVLRQLQDYKFENDEDTLLQEEINDLFKKHINELANLTDTEFIQQIEQIFDITIDLSHEQLSKFKKDIDDYVNEAESIKTRIKNSLSISGIVDGYEETGATIVSKSYESELKTIRDSVEGESKGLAWWNKTSNSKVQNLLNRYIEASGEEGLRIDPSNAVLGSDLNRRYRFQTANNQTKEITEEELISTIASYEVLDKLGDKAAEGIQVLNTLFDAQKTAIESFINNDDFSQLTKAQIDDILGFAKEEDFQNYLNWSNEDKEENAKKLGYTSFQEFYENILKGVKDYTEGEKSLTNNLSFFIKDLFTNLDSEELTLSGRKSIANILEKAFEYGGQDTANQISEILQSVPTEARTKAAEILNEIDSSSTVEDIIKQFKEASIETTNFENNLSSFVVVMRSGATQFEKVAEKYAAIHKIIDNLNLGDVISSEDYAKLDDDAKYYFDLMIDGTYKLTKDAREFYDLTQSQLLQRYENELKSLITRPDRPTEEIKTQALAYLGTAENIYDLEELANSSIFSEIGKKFGQVFVNEIIDEAKNNYFNQAFLKDLDSSKIKDLGDQLQNLKIDDKIYDFMDNATSERLAAGILRISNGIKKINSNWEDWDLQIQESGNDATEAILGLRDATAELFGVNSEYLINVLTDNFLTTNNKLIKEAANGIEDSFNKLQKAIVEALSKNLTSKQPEFVQSVLNQTKGLKYGESKYITPNEGTGYTSEQINLFEEIFSIYGLKIKEITSSGVLYIEKLADSWLASMFPDITGAGSGKQSKKEFEDEKDRYWDINNAITVTNTSMTKLESTMKEFETWQEHEFGQSLIDRLEQENDLIKQQNEQVQEQIDNYKELQTIQQGELTELKGKLQGFGGVFNGDVLTNYMSLLQTEINRMSNATAAYNAGTMTDEAYDTASKRYEKITKYIERYRTLYYDEMADAENKLSELRQEELENTLKITKNRLTQWETKINVTLDENEYKRKINKIDAELEKDFKAEFEDLTINKKYGDQNFTTYYKDVLVLQEAVANIQQQIDTGLLTTYSTIDEAKKALEEQTLKLKEAIEKTQQQVKELWNNYLNGIEQVKNKFDLINKEYSRINDQLEYERQLIELVYGDKAYNKLTKLYDTQRAANDSQIKSLQQQVAFEKEQLDIAMKEAGFTSLNIEEMTTWSNDMRRFYDNWQDSQKALNDIILNGAKLIKEEYLNNLNDIFQTMDESIWGMSFDKMKSDWDYIQNKSKEYLDDITGVYKIQTLANKIDQSIINSNNLKYQQRLKEFEDETLKYLREKENLTQTDLDIAEARYELLVKEYELEEARENKTSIKLARDASGNWSYQYVADEEKTLAKQQELSDAYNKLYEIANNGYIHSLELTQQAYEDMQQQIQELANSGELTAEKLKEIYEKYYQDYGVAANNAEIYRQEAATASSAHFDYLARMDADVYNGLTDLQKDLLDEVKTHCFVTYEDLRKQIQDTPLVNEVFEEFNQTAGSVADEVLKKWVGEDGSVQKGFSDAVKSIEELIGWYNQTFEDFNTSIGGENSPLKTINTDLDELKSKFEPLTEATENYCKNAGEYLDELRSGIQSTIEEYNKLNTAMGLDQDKDNNDKNTDNKEKQQTPADTDGTRTTGDPKKDELFNATNYDATVRGIAGSIWLNNVSGSDTANWGNDPVRKSRMIEQFGEELGEELYAAVQAMITKEFRQNWSMYESNASAYRKEFSAYDFSKISSMASGGYTGDWDSSGRLAVLHEKEIVLNAEDTSNILQAVMSIRELTRINDSINSAIAQGISRMAMDMINGTNGYFVPNNGSSTTENQFYINAEFPNANDVDSIREAILSLPNLAAQYINQK